MTFSCALLHLLLLLLYLAPTGLGVKCGTLFVTPQSNVHTGGFSKACFQKKAVTFDTCKRLLLSRREAGCSALTYSRSFCSLHDRTLPSWKLDASSYDIGVAEVGMINKTPQLQTLLLSSDLDSCAPQESTLFGPSSSNMPTCFQDPAWLAPPLHNSNLLRGRDRNNSGASRGLRRWLALPRLGIVMAVTSDWASAFAAEINSLVDSWRCYARTHNYNFHLHVMRPAAVLEEMYHSRHSDVVHAFLDQYRYLLVLDADNLVMNMSRSLDHIVNATPLDHTHPYANVDLFFHMREGGEVTASTYILRNSGFSRCFVRYWRSMAPSAEELAESGNVWIDTPNNDNGDLVAAVMNIIHPDIALKCSGMLRSHNNASADHSRLASYDRKILLCFRMFRGALADMASYDPRVQVFFIREDFFRMHSGHEATRQNQLLIKDVRCHQHDVIVHGWKQLGVRYWPGVEVEVPVSETGGNSVSTTVVFPRCDVDSFRQGEGGNSICLWLSRDAEEEIVKKHCYWRSPLCTAISPSSFSSFGGNLSGGGGRNACLNNAAGDGQCWGRERFNLMRWALCLRHNMCNPYASIAAIRDKYMPLYSLDVPW